MYREVLAAAAAVLSVQLAHARILAVSTKKPRLSTGAAASEPLVFSEGGGAYLLASNDAVRINYRGVRAVQHARLRLSAMQSEWWAYTACNVSAHALCSAADGSVLPASAAPPEFTSGARFAGRLLHCADSKGKHIVVAHAGASESDWYDISACDILDESWDIVFARNTVYIAQTDVPLGVYWTLILACVYVIRALSLNIIDKLDALRGRTSGADSEHQTKPQYMLVLVNTLVWILVMCEGTVHYITEVDFAMFHITVMYMAVYIAFHAYHVAVWMARARKYNEPRVFNLSVVSLQFVAMRLYRGVESPYAVALIGMLVVRVCDKELQKRWMHSVTALLDAFYISLLVQWAYTGDMMYMIPLFALSKVVADALFAVDQKQRVH